MSISTLNPMASPQVGAFLKRMMDVFGATFALLVLAPVFLAVAALIKISDPAGPVFYKQNRVGRAGRAIGRAEVPLDEVAVLHRPEPAIPDRRRSFPGDGPPRPVRRVRTRAEGRRRSPRVQPWPLYCRKSSLDELPHLVNALRGELSLVGPRPIITPELERYGEQGATYLSVKPGITGLWQVSGRSETGYDERVRLDVQYVNNWKLALDLAILVKTVRTVLVREGAY